MKTFRLILSKPASAFFNMSFDAWMFEQYLKEKAPTFRVYAWESPAFTYGLSSNYTEVLDLEKCVEDHMQVVARITGGGVLFHHHEITYSFVCSKDDIGEDEDVLVSYHKSCKFLFLFYQSLGLKPSFAKETENFMRFSKRHSLCSASYEKYDITLGGKKIGGNAQKRSRSVIFQHGSIPLALDFAFLKKYLKNFPLDLPSRITFLAQELKTLPARKALEEKLISAFSCAFKVAFVKEERIFSADEACLVK